MDVTLTLATSRADATITMASLVVEIFRDDTFEDCYCTDGHEEDDYLNNGQGVNETRVHIKKHPLLRWRSRTSFSI